MLGARRGAAQTAAPAKPFRIDVHHHFSSPGFIAEITVQRWTDLTGGTMGVLGIPSLDFGSRKMGGAFFLWVAGAVYLTVQILSDYVFSSRYYRVLLAIKENESAARTAG